MRVGRVDCLSEVGERDQASLDGFFKLVETKHSSILILVGGVTRLRRSQDSDHNTVFHYRYGLAHRVRFSEHFGPGIGLTALRSQGGDFSSREATLGPSSTLMAGRAGTRMSPDPRFADHNSNC